MRLQHTHVVGQKRYFVPPLPANVEIFRSGGHSENGDGNCPVEDEVAVAWDVGILWEEDFFEEGLVEEAVLICRLLKHPLNKTKRLQNSCLEAANLLFNLLGHLTNLLDRAVHILDWETNGVDAAGQITQCFGHGVAQVILIIRDEVEKIACHIESLGESWFVSHLKVQDVLHFRVHFPKHSTLNLQLAQAHLPLVHQLLHEHGIHLALSDPGEVLAGVLDVHVEGGNYLEYRGREGREVERWVALEVWGVNHVAFSVWGHEVAIGKLNRKQQLILGRHLQAPAILRWVAVQNPVRSTPILPLILWQDQIQSTFHTSRLPGVDLESFERGWVCTLMR